MMKAILFSKEGVQENSHRVAFVCPDYSDVIDIPNIQPIKMPSEEKPDFDYVQVDKRRYNLTNVINGVAFFKKEE